MGTDMYTVVEVKDNNEWKRVEYSQCDYLYKPYTRPFDWRPFDWRSYALYGFLADVRNYSCSVSIAPNRGFPEGFTDEDDYGHGCSWVGLEELLEFDYNQTFENRRTVKQIEPGFINGAHVAEPGGGEMMTYRYFLGEAYFKELEILKGVANGRSLRIIFWFDC